MSASAVSFTTPLIINESVCTIDIVRMITQVASKTYTLNGQLLVVVGAHTFTTEAQNALLKTLEEPVPHVAIIIVTTSQHALLPTVHSRAVFIKDMWFPQDLLDKAQSFIALSHAERFEECQRIADAHEKEEITRTDIAQFIDAVCTQALSRCKRGNTKKRIMQHAHTLYSLLSLPSCSVKQVCEGLALIIE